MNELFDLSGRVALITGASRGLGLSMARALGQAGAKVLLTARKRDELDAAADELRASRCHVATYVHEVAQIDTTPSLVGRMLDEFGHIDVLVNNAGSTWGAPTADYPWAAWRKVLDVNLNGAFALTREVAVRSMLPRRRGSIVTTASVRGLRGNIPGSEYTVAYNVAKAAQINLTRALAAEWGMQGVRVNALVPGWFPTKMTHGTLQKQERELTSRIPMGRLGDADKDLAGPILFLASDASRYVTGQTLIVDGGMTCCV